MTDTNLSQAVEATNDASSYDTNVKFLLADKQILARILKFAVQEFKEMDVNDIMASIGDDIAIGSKPLDAGLSNLGRVHTSNTEDNIPGEGTIFFDIRFSAYHKKMEMKFLINIEAQKSSDPGKLGYHLENRILFYLARMISAQKQTEFYHSEYDQLKKVRSIWICMDNSKDGDSIEEISLERNTVFGNKAGTSSNPRLTNKDNSYGMDLIKGIIINIRSGKNKKDSQNTLISMLEKLLSEADADEKKHILEEKYGMIMTAELEGRIQTMCNLSENIMAMGIAEGIEKGIEKGIKKGIVEGIEKGIVEGQKKERINAIQRMIKAGAAREQIVLFGYTEEELAEAENIT